MYEYFKSLVQTKPLRLVGAVLVLIAIGAVVYFCSGRSADADYQRTSDTVERAKEQQHTSIELNQSVESHIDRSTSLNREAGQRIDSAQEYQRATSQRIGESQERLDEAERLLSRNAELFRQIEQGNQSQQKSGTAIDAPAEHLGVH